MKQSFGIIEVIVSVSILIFIGITIVTLNTAGLKLANESESKTVAFAQLEQATSYFKAQKQLGTTPDANKSFLNCSTDIAKDCELSATQVFTTINRREYGTAYTYDSPSSTVTITVSWKEAGKPLNKIKVREKL